MKKLIPRYQQGQRVISSDPEYAKLYKQKRLGRWIDENNFDSQVPLDEVVVTGKDERVKAGVENARAKFAKGAMALLEHPQRSIHINHFIPRINHLSNCVHS